MVLIMNVLWTTRTTDAPSSQFPKNRPQTRSCAPETATNKAEPIRPGASGRQGRCQARVSPAPAVPGPAAPLSKALHKHDKYA